MSKNARRFRQRKIWVFSFPDLNVTTAVPSSGCHRPSIRTLGERLMRRRHTIKSIPSRKANTK